MKAIKFLSVLLVTAFLMVPLTYAAETYDGIYSVNTELSSDTDWDEILDDYEDLVDDYIDIMKDVNNGNMSAMGKLQSYLEDAQELGEKLENASDELSSSQLSRYYKILKKLSNAM